MQIDRHRNPRPFFHIPIDECSGETSIRGMTINLSEAGLCYYRPHSTQHQEGKILILSFKAPFGRRPIYVLGKVIYDHPLEDYNIICVAFQHLSEDNQRVIQNIVTQYTLSPPPVKTRKGFPAYAENPFFTTANIRD